MSPASPIHVQSFAVELVLDAATPPPADALIRAFHRVIQDGLLPDVLIDVSDYRHVPDGPGILLVAHRAFYGVAVRDRAAGRRRGGSPPATILRHERKAVRAASWEEIARETLSRALTLAALLSADADVGIGPRLGSLRLVVADRLRWPATPETASRIAAALRPLLREVAGDDVAVEATPRGGAPLALAASCEPTSMTALGARLRCVEGACRRRAAS